MSTVAPLRDKKIAFITCGYPLDVSTMLINSLMLLNEVNEVEIIVSPFDTRHEMCPEWMRRLYVHRPPLNRNFFCRATRRLFRIARRLCRDALACLGQKHNDLVWWLKAADLFRFSEWLKQRSATAGYDIIIAVECHALIVTAFGLPENCNIIYYNMELLDWGEKNPLYADKLLLKKLEHKALDTVSRVMITSESRARIFAEINGFPLERISVLPVVPRKSSFARGSKYFRDMFSIPQDKHIVIYSGNFMPWAQCLEIIESMSEWPKNAVLVMHTWNESSLSSKYFSRMQKAAKGLPVYFSSKYLAHEALPEALSSADIGLLFYEAIDANFTDIMFSSNKFGEYMAAGLPVICSPFPSLAEFIGEHGIGCTVPVEHVGTALREIIGSLEAHRKRVVLCRDEYFDFDRYFAKAFAAYAGKNVD